MRDINKYKEDYVANQKFEDVLVKYRRIKSIDFLIKNNPQQVIELGCATESAFNEYVKNNTHLQTNEHLEWLVIEPNQDFIDINKSKANYKNVKLWGTGTPKREFLHVDDMAAASIYVMNLDGEVYASHTESMSSHINVGSGIDCTIKELAETIAKVTGFDGRLIFDTSKPDGTPRKLLDVSRLRKLGWQYSVSLETGLTKTYSWYKNNFEEVRSI